jgi:ABC-type phosphate/phosphonate transport system permease subunit
VAAPGTFAQWVPVALAWLAGTFGGGATLAWLYRRLHPQLAFYKLWAMWSMVLGGVVALIFAFGVVRL